MKLLFDTNIVLEVLLEQAHAEEARQVLELTNTHEGFFSDYSLHSVGLLLFRRNLHGVFSQLMEDVLVRGGTRVVSLPVELMAHLAESAQRYRLNFDDAYQYVIAESHDLLLVSFDTDFDRTPRGRHTPAQILSRA